MKTWALIGDSQAVGLKPHLLTLMRARGYELAGSAVHGGWDTGRMIRSGEVEPIAAQRPQLVIVVLGGNDQPTEALAGKVSDLVAALRSVSLPRIVWVGPAHTTRPDVAARKDRVAAIQRQILPRLNVPWLDGNAMTAGLPHTPDGVHLTQVGLRTWAERLVPVVLRTARASSSGGWLIGISLGALVGALGLTFWAAAR